MIDIVDVPTGRTKDPNQCWPIEDVWDYDEAKLNSDLEKAREISKRNKKLIEDDEISLH